MAEADRRTLYVGALDENVTPAILRQAFVPFGEVTEAIIPLDNATSKPRGFGFVEFEDPDDAAHAIENMHHAEFYGRVLKINVARPDSIKRNKGLVTGGARPNVVWEQEDYMRKESSKQIEEEDKPADKMDTS